MAEVAEEEEDSVFKNSTRALSRGQLLDFKYFSRTFELSVKYDSQIIPNITVSLQLSYKVTKVDSNIKRNLEAGCMCVSSKLSRKVNVSKCS